MRGGQKRGEVLHTRHRDPLFPPKPHFPAVGGLGLILGGRSVLLYLVEGEQFLFNFLSLWVVALPTEPKLHHRASRAAERVVSRSGGFLGGLINAEEQCGEDPSYHAACSGAFYSVRWGCSSLPVYPTHSTVPLAAGNYACIFY